MKNLSLLLIGLSCCLSRQALAETPPRGSVLELHSCELYAGGCVVSSEATLGGRYMLRAWSFSGGSFQGTDLTGLNLAVLQSSADNLAAPKSESGATTVYLPDNATAAQRNALLGWLKSSSFTQTAPVQSRIVPIHFAKTDNGYALSAGEFISVKTASLESCATGACGEALWYTPRSQTSVFTVAVDQSSTIREPLLQMKWDDAGRRSVFLGKFGEDTSAQNLFVSSTELCGPASRLW